MDSVKSVPPERAVLTLALGKPVYIEMAYNLARSFLWWHQDSDIRFYLATDREESPPPDLSAVRFIRLKPNQYGEGFSPKLHLDAIAPADCTLFIDADCLCAGNLDPVFERFRGRPVSAVGSSISEGNWFGEVAPLCHRLGVPSLPKFNGGIYYLERGKVATQAYAQARELEKEYDALGLQRLRGRPNDELLMAMAMASHSLTALPDDGSVLSSPYECPGPFATDVMRGVADLINPPPPDPRHRTWYPFTRVHPIVVHFLGEFNRSYQYRSEIVRLRFWNSGFLLRSAVRGWALLIILLPGAIFEWLKEHFRPWYRSLFGVRALRSNERL